jgi:ATP-dependent DNA helicase RecQ
VPAETYLRQLGAIPGRPEARFPHWQSQAQKEAAWRTLTAPPGSTTLVVLPTGTGKSLICQLLAHFSQGLTVVIVPTIALAIDQWQSATQIVPDLDPLYYAAEDTSEAVLSALDQHRTRLLFTSPEACVSGRLRGLLNREASAGRLDNLVVDEVHIVETWGAYFRVDFQMLSGVRRSWMEGPGSRLRTLLLTATLTEAARSDLKQLFPPAPTAPLIELVGQRLRPEMVYYDRLFQNEVERDHSVLEALRYLPRPAILYVTEVDDAKTWHRKLSNESGYRRVGCFHGETRTRERRRLLDAWRADNLDLMVATSAFGLGVDKRDVRTVIHACFPEDMNRYYQEVGRGGRDGWSSVCLLLPTDRDFEVAMGLGPRYMTPELLQSRWGAMWQREFARHTTTADNVWQLNPAAVRSGMLGKRTGSENVRWNKRLLLQLHRAGLLRLRDVTYEYPPDEDQDRQEWIEVELRFNPNSPNVGTMIEGPRTEEVAEAKRGLEMVKDYLSGRECITRVLRRLYGPGTQRVCGGCRACRRNGLEPRECPPLLWEKAQGIPSIPRSVLVGSCPQPWRDGESAFLAFIRDCLERKNIRRFAATSERIGRLMPLFDRLYSTLPPYLRLPYRIDPPPIEPLAGESVVLLHFDRLLEEGLPTRGGREAIHCFAPPLTAQDIRYALQRHQLGDLEYHDTPERWLRS